MDGGGRQAPEQALAELYHVCYRRLAAQLYAFTNDLTEAQDAVQEAFARALARPKVLTDVGNPEAWLRTVALNVARRRWRRRRLLEAILLRERPSTRLVEPGPEPDRSDLRGALAQLPRQFREAVVLHYLGDLSVEEVAAVLDVPVGTVKSRLARGRAALAGWLDGYRPDRPARDEGHVRSVPTLAESGRGAARRGRPEPGGTDATEVASA